MKKKLLIVLSGLFLLSFEKSNSQTWSNAGNSFVCPYGVHTIVMYNGDLYVTGVTQITKWNGTAWSQVATVTNQTADQIWSMAVYNNELYISGFFTDLGGTQAGNIIKYNGSTFSPVGAGLTDIGAALGVYNGELYVTGASGAAIYNGNSIAKWDGTSWSAVGTNSNINGTVMDMIVYNGELVLTGYFSDVAGVTVSNIAKWNGTAWSALGAGTNYYTNALAVYNGELIVGGSFTGAGGIWLNCIASWNGSSWSALGSGVSGNGQGGSLPEVNAMAVYKGELYVAGEFAMAGSVTALNLAKWDGTNWYDIGGTTGGGVCGGAYSLGVFEEQLFVGGLFTGAGNISANNIAIYTSTTGINEEDNISFSVYPNPSNGVLYIEYLDEMNITRLNISDVSGKTVLELLPENIFVNENKYSLNLNYFANGNYFLNIESCNNCMSRKITVQH